MNKQKCILFIMNNSPLSQAAQASIREVVDSYEQGTIDIEVIDLNEHPQYAIEYGIIATPILIVRKPNTIERIVGDLTDIEKVKLLLKK